jgi:hypothetical protein
MTRKLLVLFVMLALVAGFAVAQDLTIDYRYNVSRNDNQSYLTFTGPIRYMAADKDHVDTSSGASVKQSTELFQPYRVDVLGKPVLSQGFRGLLLFAVAVPEQREMDNLMVTKERNGVITIQYVHRGTAYRMITDSRGRLNFPNGQFEQRKVGYIVGAGPQVISRDFSSNGTAARVDYAKVWDSGIAGGTVIDSSRADKTGDIEADVATSDSMFYWDGALQVTFDRNVLQISGGLNAIKR